MLGPASWVSSPRQVRPAVAGRRSVWGTGFRILCADCEEPVRFARHRPRARGHGGTATDNAGGYAQVLVAEDDPKQAELIRRYLVHDNHTVIVVHDGRAAIDEARRRKPDL